MSRLSSPKQLVKLHKRLQKAVRSQQLARSAVMAAAATSGIAAGAPQTIERRSAGQTGTLSNWNPRRVDQLKASREREAIVKRALDLEANDPHVSGLIESMNINTIGIGFTPQSRMRQDQLPIDAEAVKALQRQAEWNFALWSKECDLQGTKHFTDICLVGDRSMLVRGEYLILPRMVKGLGRFQLKLQVVDPLRLSTPIDKVRSDRIIDGVEVDGAGRKTHLWIHNNPSLPHQRNSANYTRIRIRVGHRLQALHGFIEKEPDQYRGQVFFSPAMKFFRDLSDHLDAELVANIVTSAVALFIASPHPDAAALAAAGGINNLRQTLPGGQRIQEVVPGGIYYGEPGQKPETLEHNRPGDNFAPFVEVILRAASSCAGIPYEVAAKKYGEMNYSSARAALLEAWRVFGHRQDWLGRHLCQPCWDMVQEEAYLLGMFDPPQFYLHREAYCQAAWVPQGHGQIDPVKEAQANILKLKYNMTTQTAIAAEDGKDWEGDIAEVRLKEREIETACGLVYPDAQKTGAGKENAK